MPTSIEWADETLNFVTGCSKVSPGCDNCYMFAQWPRLRGMKVNGYQGDPDKPVIHDARLDIPFGWKKPRKVFINSMSDTFHRDVPYDFIDDMFRAMLWNDRHIFQVLTKRPGIAAHWWENRGKKLMAAGWPRHIWLGTSVESQKYQPRMRVLTRVPAPIRFVSVEPMLGPVDLQLGRFNKSHIDTSYTYWEWHKCSEDFRIRQSCGTPRQHDCHPDKVHGGPPVSWVIVGGESGRSPRPMKEEWVKDIRDQCESAGVAFFFKQWGGRNKKATGNHLDGVQHLEFPA